MNRVAVKLGHLPALVLALVVASPIAAQTTIDFDDVENGTLIDTFYEGSDGVTFSCTGGCYAITPDFTPPSVPNVVGPADVLDEFGCFSEGDANEGLVRATFASTVGQVSIIAISDDLPGGDGDEGVLRAFDAADNQIDEDLIFVDVGTTAVLQVTGDIAYVEFAGEGTNDTCFDDLTIGGQPAPTAPYAWLALMALALVILGTWALKHRL